MLIARYASSSPAPVSTRSNPRLPAAATTTTPLATRRSHSSQIGVRPQAKFSTSWMQRQAQIHAVNHRLIGAWH